MKIRSPVLMQEIFLGNGRAESIYQNKIELINRTTNVKHDKKSGHDATCNKNKINKNRKIRFIIHFHFRIIKLIDESKSIL